MRTTLSLDDDVAAQLEEYRAKEKLTFKAAVNSVLRRGLSELSHPKAQIPFRTQPVDLGNARFPNVDNVWEILDELERGDQPAGDSR